MQIIYRAHEPYFNYKAYTFNLKIQLLKLKKMKKTISIYVIALIMACAAFTGCQSASQKEQNATDKVADAKENLEGVENQTQTDAKQLADSDEWQAFKTASLEKIQINEKLIVELRKKMKSSSQKFDAAFEKKIIELELKNNDLKSRMTTYETNQTDWILFKTEFNKDMEGLGLAIKEFVK